LVKIIEREEFVLVKKILFAALFTVGLVLSSYAIASDEKVEQIDLELYNFCSKSPLNSRCEGVEIPVFLEDRDGASTKCQLRWQPDENLNSCKFIVKENQLIIYLETGKAIAPLANKKATQEININYENIMFFPTVKKYKWVFNLAARPTVRSNVDIFFRLKPDANLKNRSNRISIYFEHGTSKDEELEQQKKLLAAFLRLHQNLNEERQSISNQIEYLQFVNSSSEENSNKKAEIDRLLDTKECVRCNLSGADLTGADLRKANLEGANLQNAILTDVKLNEAYLLGANLENAFLNKASLVAAELPYSSLTKANLQEADLSGANLQKVDLTDANLIGASASFTNLQQADLRNAKLQQASLSGANLVGANLELANLEEIEISKGTISASFGQRKHFYTLPSNFSLANLANANLSNANLKETIFYSANLTNVDFSNSNLKLAQLGNAKLANSNLTNANFNKANLVNANLANAILNNSRMTEINMSGINLSGVNLSNADLKGSTLCKATMPDGSISEEGCEQN
jgi:uncharacterized protein YjbI with pentapeptide repeats